MKLVSRRAMAATGANHVELVPRTRGSQMSMPPNDANFGIGPPACVRILRRAAIGAMMGPSEIGGPLVADSAHAGGKIVDARALADQGGETAAPCGAFGKVGDVDGEEVHGDAAGNGTAPACHHDLGGGLAPGG